ncbi:hypothetical protein [Streptomyces mirabilis]|uniref:hypothetical protein n=1 Tax=Streptomyces mirabilis TaxID=68239 RepID=UPI00368B049C
MQHRIRLSDHVVVGEGRLAPRGLGDRVGQRAATLWRAEQCLVEVQVRLDERWTQHPPRAVDGVTGTRRDRSGRSDRGDPPVGESDVAKQPVDDHRSQQSDGFRQRRTRPGRTHEVLPVPRRPRFLRGRPRRRCSTSVAPINPNPPRFCSCNCGV